MGFLSNFLPKTRGTWTRFHREVLVPLRDWRVLFERETLSRELLAAVLLSVLTTVGAMSLASYALISRQILGHIRQEIDGFAQNTALALQAFFKQRGNDLEAVSETSLIDDYHKNWSFGLAREADSYRRSLADYFVRFAGRSQVYYDIFFADASGRRVCSIRNPDEEPPPEAGVSLSSLVTLRQGRKVDLPPFRMGAQGPLVKRYAKPLFDASGQFIGGVVLDLNMSFVQEILQKVQVGRTGSAFLEDENGGVILGLRPDLRHPLLSVSPIPETRWKVGVVARADDFLGPLKRIRNLTILLSLIACGVVMVFVLWRISVLLKPVQDMVEGTRRFAAGDMTHRIPTARSLELRLLASSFNEMAEALEARSREVERQFGQLRSLREMEESVLQHGTEEVVLQSCLQAVSRAFGFDRTALYWIDDKKKAIVGKAMFGNGNTGLTTQRFLERSVPLGGDDILNEVVRDRRPVIIRNVDDPRLNRGFVEESQTREFVMAPICGKENVLGVLTADNCMSDRPLTDADREGLRVFANAVGLAMENVMLFEGLRESEAKYRTVLENSPEAVFSLSKDLTINTWNRGAEKIFGYTEENVTGRTLSVLFSAAQFTAYQAMMNQVTSEGPLRDYAVKGTSKDGKELDLSVSLGGPADFWGAKEWTMVIRDVTEAKRLQHQLIRSEKLSAVGQLISGIAHELNNPLQAVVGYADLLTEEFRGATHRGGEADGPSLLSDLKVITDNAMRCQKIIENLLLFVRQGEIEKKPVDIARVAQAAVDLLHYKLKKAANIDVTVDVSPLLSKARANYQQLQQVFVNLINNATDAMSGQAGPKAIRVTAVEKNEMIRAEVADTGPGIPENVRERLFEPFFTTKGEGRGTGLGLAVCRQIIEEHGGRMGFRSQVGYGTTFYIELPVSVDDAKAPPAAPTPPPVKDKVVLVVDDEPDVLSFLSKVILAEGDKVHKAESLGEAAAFLSNEKFDLVVADIRLGEGTGINLYENWELWSKQPRPPFLFITGDVVNPTLAYEIETKGLKLLHKPIDIASFQSAIRGLLTFQKK